MRISVVIASRLKIIQEKNINMNITNPEIIPYTIPFSLIILAEAYADKNALIAQITIEIGSIANDGIDFIFINTIENSINNIILINVPNKVPINNPFILLFIASSIFIDLSYFNFLSPFKYYY